MTLRLKTQLVAATIAIVCMVVMALLALGIARRALIASLEERVLSVAQAVAAGIDPSDLATINDRGSLGTPQYQRLAEVVREVTAANQAGLFPIRWVYLMRPTTHEATSGWDFAVDAEPESSKDWTAPGTPYSPTMDDRTDLVAIPPTPTAIYITDPWGDWLSGFAPVRAGDGRVVGLVGADINHKVITDVILAGSGSIILVTAILSISAYIAAGMSVARLLRPVESIRRFIARVGTGEFDERLVLPPTEELTVIAEDLNAMAMKLADRERLSSENRALSVNVARKEEQLVAIARVDVQLHEIQDIDILIERILLDARRLLRCDAGSVLLREGDELVLAWVQNDMLSKTLSPGQRFRVAVSRIPVGGGSIAGYVAETGHPAVIDDAYAIPADAPYHFNRSVDDSTGYRTRAVLAMPLRTGAGKIIGVLQLLNPTDDAGNSRPGFSPDDLEAIHHFASAATIALERAALTRSIVMRMIKMAELRDPSETAAHVQRVAAYAIILYEGWASKHKVEPARMESERDTLRIAAMLHDVGKVGISDAILKKPGRLTVEEYRTIQQHAVIGAQLFADRETVLDRTALEVALHHHERWDGAGYPGIVEISADHALPAAASAKDVSMMAGTQIPLFARIVAVADVFDALSSKRQYKEAWPEDRVIAEMRVNAGRQFDPELIDILLESLPGFRLVASQYK